MIVLILAVVGVCFGSFVNALVWRIRQQSSTRKRTKGKDPYSILTGRSMCPHCKHELAAKDLVPVLSWIELRGACRYCGKPISWQYPLVEVLTAVAFVVSYLWWPFSLGSVAAWLQLAVWLAGVVIFFALAVYDIHWMTLPNRLVYPVIAVSVLFALLHVFRAKELPHAALDIGLAVAVLFGSFYALFELSRGKWIGGGDVKLALALSFFALTPAKALMTMFIASVLGTVFVLPLLFTKRVRATSKVPFGPFLLAGSFCTVLLGQRILDWYSHLILIR